MCMTDLRRWVDYDRGDPGAASPEGGDFLLHDVVLQSVNQPSSGGGWPDALRDDDLAPSEETGIERERSRAEQHQSDGDHREIEGRDCLPECVRTRSEKIGGRFVE